jgi:hypothetical protein
VIVVLVERTLSCQSRLGYFSNKAAERRYDPGDALDPGIGRFCFCAGCFGESRRPTHSRDHERVLKPIFVPDATVAGRRLSVFSPPYRRPCFRGEIVLRYFGRVETRLQGRNAT